MHHRSGTSNKFLGSSIMNASELNYDRLAQQNVVSLSSSGHENGIQEDRAPVNNDHHTSSALINPSGSGLSSRNQFALEGLNAECGSLPSSYVNEENRQRFLEQRQSVPNSDVSPSTGPSIPGSSFSSICKVEVSSNLEGNAEIIERNTRRRITSVNEQVFPSSSRSSLLHADTTHSILQPSHHHWFASPSPVSGSYISPDTATSDDGNRGEGDRLDLTLGNPRAFLAHPRPEVIMTQDESNAIGPSTQPLQQHSISAQSRAVGPSTQSPLEPAVSAQLRARLQIQRAFEHMQSFDGTLQFQDDTIVQDYISYDELEDDDYDEDALLYIQLHGEDMLYEELLALGEHIENVGSGLSEEAILAGLKKYNYHSLGLGPVVEDDLCCICRDDYADGEELAKLDCRHIFHFSCIRQWLMQKNTCPICKATAVAISHRE
ncbi:hypothetical protein NMG60_11016307 [Bertholletia excelsa]